MTPIPIHHRPALMSRNGIDCADFTAAQQTQAGPPRLRSAGPNKVPRLKKCLLPVAFVCAFASSVLAQSLFVVTKLSDKVAVIDSSTDEIITEIPVGANPIRINMTPDRLKAYVSNWKGGTVSVLNTITLETTA